MEVGVNSHIKMTILPSQRFQSCRKCVIHLKKFRLYLKYYNGFAINKIEMLELHLTD